MAEREQRHVLTAGAKLARDLECEDAAGAIPADQIRPLRPAPADDGDDRGGDFLEGHARTQLAFEDGAKLEPEERPVGAHALRERDERRAAVEPQHRYAIAERLERHELAEVRCRAAVDPRGEFTQGRGVEEFRHADAAAPLLLDPDQQSRDQQRMPAQLEEAVVAADLLDAQQIAPDRCELLLGLALRRFDRA